MQQATFQTREMSCAYSTEGGKHVHGNACCIENSSLFVNTSTTIFHELVFLTIVKNGIFNTGHFQRRCTMCCIVVVVVHSLYKTSTEHLQMH